jgi:hypothetical protein
MGCSRSTRLVLVSLAMAAGVACSSVDFSSGRGPDDASATDADSNTGEEDASDSGPRDAGDTDARAEAAAPTEINLEIENDADDATWIGGSDERLVYGDEQPFIEVGADSEFGRAGLRFELPIPPSSTIHSATLRVRRVAGTAEASETLSIQVWDSADLAPFDETHSHLPREHAPGGLWAVVVRGLLAGADGALLESPNLAELVQHVIDRSDWQEGGAIGFYLSPDTVQTWLGLADSSRGDRASLRIVFTPGA